MTRCRSCGAPMFYAISEKTGGRIPVNPDPSPKGNLAIEFPIRGDPIATVVKEPARATCALYLSHFADCPNASSHRRKRK